MGLLAALRGHGPTPGYHRGLKDGARIWWVAPSYPGLDSSDIWPQLKRALEGCWVDKHEVSRTITLANGASISVRSADKPKSLRGAGLDGLVVDEAAFLEKSAWTEALRATVADKDGWVMFQTTPNGRNWLYKEWRDIPNRPRWNRWQMPSSQNPLMREEILDEIRQEVGPRTFAQEYLAEFMEVEGALWPADYFEDHIWADDWPDRFEMCATAVDPSMGATETSDYSAIVTVGLARGMLWVDSDIRRRPPLEIVGDTVTAWQHYTPDRVGVEWEAMQGLFGPLFDLYCEQNSLPPLPLSKVRSERAGKVQRIQRLDPYLANRRFRLRRTPSNDTLLEQMMMFPLKSYHDDGPDALEMAVRLLNRMRRPAAPPEEVLVT